MDKFISAYGPKLKCSIVFPEGEGRTKQSCKAECDINLIVKTYDRTGVLGHVRDRQGEFGDFDSIDFHSAMNIVAGAKSMFADLPSALRNRFDNDPGLFLDFIHDPDSAEELVEMGLANAPKDLIVDPVLDSGPLDPLADPAPGAPAEGGTPEPPAGA